MEVGVEEVGIVGICWNMLKFKSVGVIIYKL